MKRPDGRLSIARRADANYGRLLRNLLLFLLATCALLLAPFCTARAPFRPGCAPLLAPFCAGCAPLLAPLRPGWAPLLAPLRAGLRSRLWSSGLRSGLRGSGLLCYLLGCLLGRRLHGLRAHRLGGLGI